jgi:hypothetical protein
MDTSPWEFGWSALSAIGTLAATVSLIAVNGPVCSNYLALSGLPIRLGTPDDLQ